jgi:CubicO group peptidase (beta-lactamase class C family)
MEIQKYPLEDIDSILQVDSLIERDSSTTFGSEFDPQDFYKPFMIEEITPENQQIWPFYKYVSAHWDEFAGFGTKIIDRSPTPTKLSVAEGEQRLDLNSEWKEGQTFLQSLQATQVKAFVVMKDNKILAEFYNNGFLVSDKNLLQSAAKTFAGVITHQLMDQGLLDPEERIWEYLKDFKGTALGDATVQQVLDFTSGLPDLLDFHTPGDPAYLYEIEIGLKSGPSIGHRTIIKTTEAVAKPGEKWHYSDKNTDTLGLLAEKVSQKTFPELLSYLFKDFGANWEGSIALTSDGSTAPCFGISITARDYALFHQWIAERKAPKCYYESAMDTSKTKIGENEAGKLLGTRISYGSQSYYLVEHDCLSSSGSFGQLGYSDMKTGVSVVFFQDWAANVELDKFMETRHRAMSIIYTLRDVYPPMAG